MLKSLRYQFMVNRLRKTEPSRIWYEGSVEDEEEEEDEKFCVVEPQGEQADRQRLDSDCTTWDVSRLLGFKEINSNLLYEPKLSEHSKIISLGQIQQLSQYLPDMLSLFDWMLIYQMQKHGSSLQTLYRMAGQLDHCMVMFIQDTYGQVFGAVCSAPLRVSSSYYGTGQTFLFSFSPHLQVYKWTGTNSYFIKGNADSLLFGGGRGKFGIWLHGDLVRGRSQSCDTFDNDVLSSVEDFKINDLELWALV